MGVYEEGSGYKYLAYVYNYIIGGINTITDIQVHDEHSNNSVISNPSYGNGVGASPENPLPNGIRGGDSGSPIFVYNKETKRYEYLSAQQSSYDEYVNGWSHARGNVPWTKDTLESFNAHVSMSAGTATVYLNAVTTNFKGNTTLEVMTLQRSTVNLSYAGDDGNFVNLLDVSCGGTSTGSLRQKENTKLNVGYQLGGAGSPPWCWKRMPL